MKIDKKGLYFCYDIKVKDELYKRGIKYLCHAIAVSSGKEFWLYYQTEKLAKVLQEVC